MRYLSSSKIDKPKVAKEVVQIWKSLTPPGRFLQKKDASNSGNSPQSPSSDASKSDGSTDSAWVPVSDKKAREKASQCLRERTADVVPYLSQLQQQRDHMREQGVSMISHHLAAAQQNGEELPKGRPLGRYGSLSGMSSGRGGMDHHPSHNRRISMPAGRSPATPVTPMDGKGTPADRRMSMPAGGSSAKASMVPSSAAAGRMGMGHHSFGRSGMEQQVLQDAYSAIERAGGPDPANVMFMEQLLQEERMMERETMLAERQALVSGCCCCCCFRLRVRAYFCSEYVHRLPSFLLMLDLIRLHPLCFHRADARKNDDAARANDDAATYVGANVALQRRAGFYDDDDGPTERVVANDGWQRDALELRGNDVPTTADDDGSATRAATTFCTVDDDGATFIRYGRSAKQCHVQRR